MVKKMQPVGHEKQGNRVFYGACPQCGGFLAVLHDGGDVIVQCSKCGTYKKVVVRKGRVTTYELDEALGM